ncbi:hypothetical protein IWX90DRAFT_410927 [Phyllosticta citrichinensis]|uniref:Uncharacterized protein n=1 Tax=Phyllosticta citrichinensis TaxID=1130410 RepID=A0ABR1Y765_9PEZI
MALRSSSRSSACLCSSLLCRPSPLTVCISREKRDASPPTALLSSPPRWHVPWIWIRSLSPVSAPAGGCLSWQRRQRPHDGRREAGVDIVNDVDRDGDVSTGLDLFGGRLVDQRAALAESAGGVGLGVDGGGGGAAAGRTRRVGDGRGGDGGS